MCGLQGKRAVAALGPMKQIRAGGNGVTRLAPSQLTRYCKKTCIVVRPRNLRIYQAADIHEALQLRMAVIGVKYIRKVMLRANADRLLDLHTARMETQY